MDDLQGASEVRDEDAFDTSAVVAWLIDQGVDLGTSSAADLVVRQFGGGASNLTYSLRTPTRDLILRRPPTGKKAAGAHDMAREFRIQSALKEPFGLVPNMVALCQDEAVIGSQFYVMERIDGVIPRRELGVELSPEHTRTLCLNALGVLIDLHQTDPAVLADLGKGAGYVRRQVEGWSARFRAARTPDVGACEAVMAWLAAHQPEDVASVVIHNDFRFDNLVLDSADPTQVVGVLDWEMATIGDPLMDLGGSLAYWVQADDDEFFSQFRRQPTHLPGMLTRAEVVEHYCAAMGYQLTPEQWRFYEVFGLFRLAVIAQQIYFRYFHKQTTNPAYAVFGPAATYLETRCLRIIGAA